ncbi:MAG: MAE_28990/MAE_18760 family HEPN-like nuclease [Candidatus Melainabacteria bacterium]|jgi:hypothetical protein
MSSLEEKLKVAIDWRVEELSLFKHLIASGKLAEKEKEIFGKYLITAIYALWEGFITDSFEIYIDELNGLSLEIQALSQDLIQEDLKVKYEKLQNIPKSDFVKQSKSINELNSHLNNCIQLEKAVKSSNGTIAFKEINKILTKFYLNNLPQYPWESEIKQFVKDRNAVAHGDFRSLKATDLVITINGFCNLLSNLMDEILTRILDGYIKKTYLQN